jgi:hypothetical protein
MRRRRRLCGINSSHGVRACAWEANDLPCQQPLSYAAQRATKSKSVLVLARSRISLKTVMPELQALEPLIVIELGLAPFRRCRSPLPTAERW